MDAADLTLSILSIFGEHCILVVLGLSRPRRWRSRVPRTTPVWCGRSAFGSHSGCRTGQQFSGLADFPGPKPQGLACGHRVTRGQDLSWSAANNPAQCQGRAPAIVRQQIVPLQIISQGWMMQLIPYCWGGP